MAVAETRMYVLTDAKANNNKFWEVTIDETGNVSTRNGRVGTKGTSRKLGNGEALMNRKIREKERKGYKKIDIVGSQESSNATGAKLASAAEDQIAKGDAVVAELVRELARMNRHQLLMASGGQMDLDLDTGIISTPIGVVTADNIDQARKILTKLEPFVAAEDFDDRNFIDALEQYLMLVPQKVGSRQGWHRSVLPEMKSLTEQGALLDQMEGSIATAEQRVKDAAKNVDGAPVEKIFDVSLKLSEDPKLRKKVEAFYQKGRKTMHASHRLTPARIFDISLGQMDRDFAEDGEKVGGRMDLWHGTRAHNLLSILKSGLIIPKSSGSIHVTGRMFGDGLYFSDQSTKSLNYAYGYWDGGRQDDKCYMFLADVAMGRPWHPDRTGSNVKPPKGYDSVFARGGQDRVMNNEMIVYRTSQARMKYLVEFSK
jgi:poly [ADP-ribose] polymerase